jgi:hypothetical protein
MDVRRITFRAPFPEPHLSIDCWPPFVDWNLLFRAAFRSFVDPYQLAIQAGKVSEETATRVMAQAYSEGVAAGSPTEGYESMTGPDWCAFFLKHPDHFEELRSYLEVRHNWEEPGGAGDGEGAAQHAG